jgi:hypothetical protein
MAWKGGLSGVGLGGIFAIGAFEGSTHGEQ